MTVHNSLNTFYQSAKAHNPMLGVLIADDVIVVMVESRSTDKSVGQEAADRLRQRAITALPESLSPVLENALTELGYS